MAATERELRFMRMALQEGNEAFLEGEVPVGCVIVHSERDELMGVGHNFTNAECNATRHAEFVAIDNVLEKTGNANILTECDLFVTCEPCIMCAAALAFVKIRRLYFGCSNDKFGGCGSIMDVHNGGGMPPGQNTFPVKAGIMKEEAIALLRGFYNRENINAPKAKRRKKQNGGSSVDGTSVDGSSCCGDDEAESAYAP